MTETHPAATHMAATHMAAEMTGAENAAARTRVIATAHDARADSGARRVAVDARGVAIVRRYLGIDMRMAVPIKAYRGILLTTPDADDRCEVRLTHDDPDLSVTLESAAGADAMIEAGRSWARVLDLPILVEGARGRLHRLGAIDLQKPATPPRRRGGPPRGRRPRFLLRRKIGDRRPAVVHGGEREIFSY